MIKEKKLEKTASSKKTISLPGKRGSWFWYTLVLVGSITFLVFLPALSNNFLSWDDQAYTWDNPYLKNFSFSEVFSFSTYLQGNYHPLTLLWLHLEWLLFPAGDPDLYGGLDPFWFHLNNVLLHTANSVLVFLFIRRLTGKEAWIPAAVTAILFGIHPMHVESVAWVAELKDVLYGFFFLSALLAYTDYLKKQSAWRLLLVLILFLLSILSKAQAVTLPLVLLLVDYYTRRRNSWKLWAEKVPFLVLSLFFGLLAIRAQASTMALDSGGTISLNSLLYAGYGLIVYLYKLLLPVNLSAVYPYPYKGMDLPVYFFAFPVIILLLSAGVLLTARRSRVWIFGFFFFLVTISVVIKVIPVGESLVNERYTYIPYTGLFFLVGHLFAMMEARKHWRTVTWTVLGLMVIVLSAISFHRTGIWKNNDTFFDDMIVKQPGYWRGYYGKGVSDYRAGLFEEAFRNADAACRKDPPAAPFMLRGALYLNHLMEPDSALADFKKVISFREKGSPFEYQARMEMSRIYSSRGQYAEAAGILGEAIAVNPSGTEALMARGMLYIDNLGQPEAGLADFQKILEMVPVHPEAELGAGFSYFKMNRYDDAISQFNAILARRPGEGRVYYFRALALAAKGQYADAWRDGMKARETGFAVSDSDLEQWKYRMSLR